MAKFSIITCEKDFINLSQKWNDLYFRSNSKTVFQSFNWNFQWYKNAHVSDKLFIITMFNQSPKTIDAIFPFVIDKRRTLRFIGDIHSDYGNFLITDFENGRIYEVFKLLKNIINDSKDISSIELKNIVQNNTYLGFISNLFDFKQFTYSTNGFSSISIKSHENFWNCFNYLNSKGRNELKRVYKKNNMLECRLFEISKNIFPKEKVLNLFDEMVYNKVRDKAYLNEAFLVLIESMYNSGDLHVFEVYQADQSFAIKLILKGSENHHIFWIDLYKDIQMINIHSYIEYIKTVCNKETKEFILDFGRGLYDYKLKNFQPNIGLQHTFFYSKSNFRLGIYMFRLALKTLFRNFYKNKKAIINKILIR